MKVYPAIKAQMGRWDYFIVRMSMRELAEQIMYAEEVHGATQLSDAIQRRLVRSRAKKQIASYLVHQEDRLFSCIVVAALGGEPRWYPVEIENDPKFTFFRNSRRLTESFGVLIFDGSENYYALDGQHRLAAIRSLIDGKDEYVPDPSFRDEEIAVLIVTPRQMEDNDEFMIRYRRLFSNLNRYAKPMSKFDIIVMDEDDPFAVITRRLVTEHKFFRVVGDQFESARIKMEPGKNVRQGSSHFTSLEMLYAMNIQLLATRSRRNNGWGSAKRKLTEYTRFRPPEEEIESLYSESFLCWDALIRTLPVLEEDPSRMRHHNLPEDEGQADLGQDCVLFWPIVQDLLARLTRELLDDAAGRLVGSDTEGELDLGEMCDALEPLRHLNWDAHSPPWRHVLLVRHVAERQGKVQWRIASEDRLPRIRLIERILLWQCGLDPLTNEDIFGETGIHELWKQYLPAVAADRADEMWAEIEANVRR